MLTKLRIGAALLIAGLAGASRAQSAPSITLEIWEGRVWLTADHASVAQILEEWARVGHTQILGGTSISGASVSLVLSGVPELEALEIIMRPVGGFMTASRTAGAADEATNISRFSRVVIVPPSSMPADRATQAPSIDPAMPMPAPPFLPTPIVTESGAQRVIGADGQPVPDDQDGAPPPPSIPPPVPSGVTRPGVITPPAVPPRRPGAS